MKRRRAKHLKSEVREMDYLDKLAPEELAWMEQFLLEYYQGDFNFPNKIHPKDLKKDCQDRNNSFRRQWDSIGRDLQEKAVAKATRMLPSGHYHPVEYCSDKLPPESDLWEDYAEKDDE